VFTNILDHKCKYPQVGANATIVCGNTLGKHCLIGAGSVVTKDVPDYALVVGVPGKIIGWVSEAGKRLAFDNNGFAYCEKSNKKYKLENNLVIEIE